MLYQQLTNLRDRISRHEIKVSDAILLSLRILRECLPAHRLLWLNRELLGYSKEDLRVFDISSPAPNLSKFFEGLRISKTLKASLDIPNYRYLSGAWGTIDHQGKFTVINDSRLACKSIFCNVGIQQIETQLDEVESPLNNLFSMSCDQLTGAEFFCWSKELFRVYEAVRSRLCTFLDTAIEELELVSKEYS